MQSFEMNQLHWIATIFLSLILGTNAFSYKDAKNWGKTYPQCNGRQQSPMLMKIPDFQDYKKTMMVKNFQKIPKKLTIQNTGHTVEITADFSGEPPKISNGPLNGTYVLGKTTLHWAQKKWSNGLVGSFAPPETLVQDMEMHLKFYKTDFKSFEEAEKQKGGLAVVGMGFTNGYYSPDHLFDNLEKNLHKVRSPKSKAEIPPFCFTKIIYESSKEVPFYHYEGSLDYPPCLESVPWFMLDTGDAITDGLIQGLRKLKLVERDVSNVRPYQPTNGRKNWLVYNHENHEDLDKLWTTGKL